MQRKQDTHRKGKSTSVAESDSEEKPAVFTKQDFDRALKKVSHRLRKPDKEKS